MMPGADSDLPLRSTKLVGLLLAVGAVEGIAALIAVLLHISEPGSRVLGPYSAERWGMILLLMMVILSCAAGSAAAHRRRPAIVRFASLIFDREGTIPNGIVLLLTLCIALFPILAVVKPDIIIRTVPQIILQAIPARVSLMLPVFLWVSALLAQILLVWRWRFRRLLPPKPRFAGDLIAVAAITALAIVVRIPLIGYGLPYEAAWDEVVTYPQALQALVSSEQPEPGSVPGYDSAGYGEILTTLTKAASIVGLFESLRSQTVSSVEEYVSPPRGVESVLQAVHPSGNPLLYPRALFVLLNSLAPLAIYLILRGHLRCPVLAALGGALPYAAFNWNAISYSSFIYPDALATTLMLFCLLFAFKGMDDASVNPRTWLAAGLLAGVAASTSMRSALLPVMPLVALSLSLDRTRLRTSALALASGIAVGYVLSSPSVVLDLPAFLARAAGLEWFQNTSLHGRAEGLVFHLQALFSPTPTAQGLAVLGLFAVGAYRGITRAPRAFFVVALFSAGHLYLITPLLQRYPRHSLVLLPFVCLAVGCGLEGISAWLARALAHWRSLTSRTVGQITLAATLGAFVLLSLGQLKETLDSVNALQQFEPSQIQAAKFLARLMTNDDIVGVQVEIPFVEADLIDRGLAFERITSDQTVTELRRGGVTYVLGTGKFGGDYSLPATGLWHGAFDDPSTWLAQFGTARLEYAGWPSANLFVFVARVPDS